jgi:hypothetical protein
MGCGCAVPAVLGILVVFGMLWLGEARAQRDPRWDRSALATCEDNLRHIGLAIESYQGDHQRPPARLDDLVPRYIDAWRLHCPLEARGGKAYRHTPDAPGADAAIVTCENHAHGAVHLLRSGRIQPPKGG